MSWFINVFSKETFLDDEFIVKSIPVEYDPGDNFDDCIYLNMHNIMKFPEVEFDFCKYDYFLENKD